MSAFHVIAAALSARQEELTGEASPLDYDGARLVLSHLVAASLAVVEAPIERDRRSPQSGSGPVDVIGGQPGPGRHPRVFALYRHRDPSGVSGTGVVADGVVFSDGSVALRWPGANPSTAAWPNLAAVLAVHGHQGATEALFADEVTVDLWPSGGGSGE